MVFVVMDRLDTRIAFMEKALDEANVALTHLEVPVGCVIVENGQVIANGSNRTNETRNATRHAEMEAIDKVLDICQAASLSQEQAAQKFGKCELYVTCEPCIMCATALSIVGIRSVYYGCNNDRFGGCGSVMALQTQGCGGCGVGADNEEDVVRGGFKCVGGLMAEEAVALLRSFYGQGNPNAPKPHRPLKITTT